MESAAKEWAPSGGVGYNSPMETIVHNIRDLSGVERSAMERLVGHALGENQQVVIHVVSPESSQPAAETSESSPEAAATQLPDYCNVYDGLSDEEIEVLDQAIRERANLTREFE